MSICVIDYGSGNVRSVQKAAQKASGVEVLLTNNLNDINNATHIILPGVGAFGDCRKGLDAVDGLIEALHENVINKRKPFLGICVGMQLLADEGHEKGVHQGLGWISGKVIELTPNDPSLKVPQMGWNTLDLKQSHPLFDDFDLGPNGKHAYFANSFQFKCADNANQTATCNYGGDITAIVHKDNILGTQFHPEKSQVFGLALLEKFVRWHP